MIVFGVLVILCIFLMGFISGITFVHWQLKEDRYQPRERRI